MTDEEIKTYATGAVRSDVNDVRYDLVSPQGLRRLAMTYAEGAQKYSDHNWRKGMPWSETLNHAIKHMEQWKVGDTTEDHLAHAAWGLFALMEFEETHPELDDRFVWEGKTVVPAVEELEEFPVGSQWLGLIDHEIWTVVVRDGQKIGMTKENYPNPHFTTVSCIERAWRRQCPRP